MGLRLTKTADAATFQRGLTYLTSSPFGESFDVFGQLVVAPLHRHPGSVERFTDSDKNTQALWLSDLKTGLEATLIVDTNQAAWQSDRRGPWETTDMTHSCGPGTLLTLPICQAVGIVMEATLISEREGWMTLHLVIEQYDSLGTPHVEIFHTPPTGTFPAGSGTVVGLTDQPDLDAVTDADGFTYPFGRAFYFARNVNFPLKGAAVSARNVYALPLSGVSSLNGTIMGAPDLDARDVEVRRVAEGGTKSRDAAAYPVVEHYDVLNAQHLYRRTNHPRAIEACLRNEPAPLDPLVFAPVSAYAEQDDAAPFGQVFWWLWHGAAAVPTVGAVPAHTQRYWGLCCMPSGTTLPASLSALGNTHTLGPQITAGGGTWPLKPPPEGTWADFHIVEAYTPATHAYMTGGSTSTDGINFYRQLANLIQRSIDPRTAAIKYPVAPDPSAAEHVYLAPNFFP